MRAPSSCSSTRRDSLSDGGVEANYPTPVQIARLDGPWTVDFLDKVRGPKEPVVFEALTDWTTNSDDLIKYYSGTAVYKSSFKLDAAPDGNHILIDLAISSPWRASR